MTTTEILTGIKNWVLSKLSLKQDVISDLASIRSGAQAGATAVQPSDLSEYFNDASYDTSTHRINFYHGQDIVAYVDASPFIVDGMVDDVRIENGYLVIDFNTESGKQDISIPLTDIFDPSNYYNKTQTDTLLGNKVDKVSGKGLSTNDYTNAEKEKLSGLQNYDDTQVRQLIGQKQDIIQDLDAIRSGASAGTTAVQPSVMDTALANTVAESGVYDVTANNNNAKFASLSALLSSENLDTLIPSAKRKGGMSIKFVLSSDNKYVQFRCMADSFTTDVTKWQGVDDEPTAGSDNLVKSGGVYKEFCTEFDGNYTPTAAQNRPLIGMTLKAGITYRLNVRWGLTQGNLASLGASNSNSGNPKDTVISSIYSGTGSRTVEYTPSVDVSYWYITMATGYTASEGDFVNINVERHYTIEEIVNKENSTSASVQTLRNDFDNGNFPSDSISHTMIKDNAVESNNVKDGAVSTNKIANGGVVYSKTSGVVKNAINSVSDNIGYKVSVDGVGAYTELNAQFVYPIPIGTIITNNGVKVTLATDSSLTTRKDLSNGSTWKSTFAINFVKTLETAGNVRLVLDNREQLFNGISFGSSNIQNDAIGIEKLSITAHGTNICDHEFDTDFAAGKYITANNGALDSNASYDTSGFIPIEAGKSYSYTNGGSSLRFVLQYNASKQAISSTYESYKTTFQAVEGAAFARVTFNHNGPLFLCEGAETKPYEDYREFISPDYLPKETDYNDYSDLFFLPKHIYVASGRTIEIYYNQIMLNAEKYNIKATCSIGKALDRKFQIIGDNSYVGNTYTLSINVYNDFGVAVASGTSTIHIVANTISSAKAILPVGDSLTNGKAWLSELHNLSSNLSTVGTRQSVHEGRSGVGVTVYTNVEGGIVYSYDNQYSGVGYNTAPTFDNTQSYSIGDKVKIAHTFGNGSSGYRYWVFTSAHAPGAFNEAEAYCFSDGNPFYDYVNDKFSMNFYRTFQNINFDAIILFLGTNGINLTPETNPNGALGIKNLIELIREDEPTIPIVVVNTIFRSSQNGIGNQGNTDGYTAQSAYKFNEDKKVLLLGQAVDKMCGSMSNVYLCPVGFTHDSKYNFGNTKIAVNPRLTDTTDVYELQPSDSIHPQTPGYMQMADEIFSTLCAIFNS